MAINIRTTIRSAEFQAEDGAKGVAMAGSDSLDLILMNISLPEIDGWEANRRIK